jgi:hypothetical protein
MEEKSGVTLLSNHLRLQQQLMEQEPFMLVLVDLLMLVIGQSLNSNKLLVKEKSNSQVVDVINQ